MTFRQLIIVGDENLSVELLLFQSIFHLEIEVNSCLPLATSGVNIKMNSIEN